MNPSEETFCVVNPLNEHLRAYDRQNEAHQAGHDVHSAPAQNPNEPVT